MAMLAVLIFSLLILVFTGISSASRRHSPSDGRLTGTVLRAARVRVAADEVALFSKPIRDFVEKVTALADSAADPSAYATQLLARLCPGVLPYELDTPAAFTFAAFNGRSLRDDVMDVILTLATNTALGDGVAPDERLMRPDFPYFGEPLATAANSAKQ